MKILFSGCSITAGDGLDDGIVDSNNYPNIFVDNLYPDATLTNIAYPGNSNHRIFTDVCRAIWQEHYDIVFVGITSYPRHEFFFDFGVWEGQGNCRMGPASKPVPYQRLPSVQVTKSDLKNLQIQLSKTHDHYHITELLSLTSILTRIHPNVYFINVIAPWSANFFNCINFTLPSDLDLYTQKLLDVDNRTDDDIKLLYQKMHRDYVLAVGKDNWNFYWNRWVNLYDNMRNHLIDVGNDQQHPGPDSHKKFSNILIKNYSQIINLS